LVGTPPSLINAFYVQFFCGLPIHSVAPEYLFAFSPTDATRTDDCLRIRFSVDDIALLI